MSHLVQAQRVIAHSSVSIIATLILGWTMQTRANLAVPVVFSFFLGVGTSFLATSRSWRRPSYSS